MPKSLDARYDQERKLCTCGAGVFVLVTLVQVHQQPGCDLVYALPPYIETVHDNEALLRLPVAECVHCRTRYDRLWREVV